MNNENSPDLEHHEASEIEEDSSAEKLNQAMDDERTKMRDAITNLSKIATLTIADSYSTEDMGVVFAPGYQEKITSERNRLNEKLGDVSRQWAELNDTVNEVQRSVGSLQYMIDPENN